MNEKNYKEKLVWAPMVMVARLCTCHMAFSVHLFPPPFFSSSNPSSSPSNGRVFQWQSQNLRLQLVVNAELSKSFSSHFELHSQVIPSLPLFHCSFSLLNIMLHFHFLLSYFFCYSINYINSPNLIKIIASYCYFYFNSTWFIHLCQTPISFTPLLAEVITFKLCNFLFP